MTLKGEVVKRGKRVVMGHAVYILSELLTDASKNDESPGLKGGVEAERDTLGERCPRLQPITLWYVPHASLFKDKLLEGVQLTHMHVSMTLILFIYYLCN